LGQSAWLVLTKTPHRAVQRSGAGVAQQKQHWVPGANAVLLRRSCNDDVTNNKDENGFMKTALANSQGELVIPALVTGTFSNPRFSPDVQQLAQTRLKNVVPNMNNPASVAGTLQNLLGGLQTQLKGSSRQKNSHLNYKTLCSRSWAFSGRRKTRATAEMI